MNNTFQVFLGIVIVVVAVASLWWLYAPKEDRSKGKDGRAILSVSPNDEYTAVVRVEESEIKFIVILESGSEDSVELMSVEPNGNGVFLASGRTISKLPVTADKFMKDIENLDLRTRRKYIIWLRSKVQ